jgi:hypothetical protein
MNMQRRSDERSIALHREIAKKLRSNPSLWEIPKNNIDRWKKMKERLSTALSEWEHILNTNTKEQILSILESDSEESTRLRSSSPFTGILNENERKMIFKFYSIKQNACV